MKTSYLYVELDPSLLIQHVFLYSLLPLCISSCFLFFFKCGAYLHQALEKNRWIYVCSFLIFFLRANYRLYWWLFYGVTRPCLMSKRNLQRIIIFWDLSQRLQREVGKTNKQTNKQEQKNATSNNLFSNVIYTAL